MAIVLLLDQMLRHFRGCCKLLRSFLTYRLIMMIKFQVFYIAIPYLLAHHEAGISIVLNSLLFRFYSFNSLCTQLNSSSQTVRKPSIKKEGLNFLLIVVYHFVQTYTLAFQIHALTMANVLTMVTKLHACVGLASQGRGAKVS